MKIRQILLGLVLLSLVFILPSIQGTDSYALIPNSENEFILQITTPMVELSLQSNVNVDFEIYHIDLNSNQETKILEASFNVVYIVDFPNVGTYRLILTTSQLNAVEIDYKGFWPSSIVISGLLLLINIIYVFYDQYKARYVL